jgi:hypothetical protein
MSAASIYASGTPAGRPSPAASAVRSPPAGYDACRRYPESGECSRHPAAVAAQAERAKLAVPDLPKDQWTWFSVGACRARRIIHDR